MKIEGLDVTETIAFYALPIGAIFASSVGNVFMKIKEISDAEEGIINAVFMDSGEFAYFYDKDEYVMHFSNAKLVVR